MGIFCSCISRSSSPLPQRIVDRRAAQQVGHQYCRKTGREHRQQHCEARGHLDDEDDAGDRGLHDAGEEGSHADHGECFGRDAEIGKGDAAESAAEKTELRSENEHRGEQPAWGRCRIGDRAESKPKLMPAMVIGIRSVIGFLA